jgi:GntR family transcriptional regulator
MEVKGLLIILRPDHPRPIYQQIIDQVKEQIMNGLLGPGEELPSVRQLADQLQVNMHTVHRAYQELKKEDIVIMRLGQKVRIAATVRSANQREDVREKLKEAIQRLVVDAFHYGYSKEELNRLFQEQLHSQSQSPPEGKEF